MYARLVLFSLNQNGVSKAQSLADDLVAAISEQPGCASVTFFGDAADGDHGLFVLWESKEDAEAGASVVGPKLMGGLSGNIQAPPTIRLFEVLKQ